MSSTQQSHEMNKIKDRLQLYSRFLRRDFLAVLVKMLARELRLKTVRTDWRTRAGMMTFLNNHWDSLEVLLGHRTCFQWFCQSFNQIEKILSIRKFVLHIYSNWNDYSSYLQNDETKIYLKQNQEYIETVIQSDMSISEELENKAQIFQIIKEFKSGSQKEKKVEAQQIPQSHQEILFDPSEYEFGSDPSLCSFDPFDCDFAF